MAVYGFHLLDFMPNAMVCMAIFAHLCENFVGVAPNVDLFRHYFVPRVENKTHRSGNISWMPRVMPRENWDYISGQQRSRWEEWRGDRRWIQDKEAPEFCQAWTECLERDRFFVLSWGNDGSHGTVEQRPARLYHRGTGNRRRHSCNGVWSDLGKAPGYDEDTNTCILHHTRKQYNEDTTSYRGTAGRHTVTTIREAREAWPPITGTINLS